jgi:hypothetical protein
VPKAKRATSQAGRYQQLVREVSRQLDGADDHVVEHVAGLRLARESFTARMVSGDDVDPSVMLKFDEALAKYMPTSKPIRIELLRYPADTKCPECGWSPPVLNRPGESLVDALRRERIEEEAAEAAATGVAQGAQTPVAENNASTTSPSPANTVAKTVEPKPPRPFHEVYARDSRPNAPRSLADNAGSVVWFGVQGSKKEGF